MKVRLAKNNYPIIKKIDDKLKVKEIESNTFNKLHSKFMETYSKFLRESEGQEPKQ